MMPMFRSELFRATRRLLPRVLVGVAPAVVIALYLLLWVSVESAQETEEIEDLREALRIGRVHDLGLGLVSLVATVVVAIMTASSIGSEFGWGTVGAMLPRAGRRAPFLTAKLVASGLFAVLTVIVGTAAALAASYFVTVMAGLDREFPSDFGRELTFAVGRVIYVTAPYIAFALFVSVITQSSGAGIGMVLTLVFLEGPIMALIQAAGGPLEKLPHAFPNANVSALLAVTAEERPEGLPNAWQAAGVLAAYAGGFVAATYAYFQTADVRVR